MPRMYDREEYSTRCSWTVQEHLVEAGPAKRATRPFEKVTFDLIISTVTSVEGYTAAAPWVDDCSGFKWLYGLKTKDEVVGAAKRWMAETADLREKYPLFVVMRDNAGENKSEEI